MEDDYGIPEQIFGEVPEEFYGRHGRVVMVTAMLDLRLYDLLTELARPVFRDEPVFQDTFAGEHGSAVIVKCSAQLSRYEPAFGQRATELLEQAQDVMNGRNDVIHSVWPHPTVETAFGWRPVRNRPPGEPYKSVTLTDLDVRLLIGTTVDLINELDSLRNKAAFARLPVP